MNSTVDVHIYRIVDAMKGIDHFIVNEAHDRVKVVGFDKMGTTQEFDDDAWFLPEWCDKHGFDLTKAKVTVNSTLLFCGFPSMDRLVQQVELS